MAANDRVGNVYLDVLPRGDGFNKNVQSIIDKAERDAKFAVNANTGPAKKAVSELADQIQNDVGGAWLKSAAQAAAFTGAVYAVKASVEGVINKFSELFDGIAKARAGFNAILGEKTGETLLSQVRQFAIDSPFVTGELVNYSQQLLGVGKAANTIVPILKNVGDIVASVGGDTSNLGSILYAMTQIQTIGKLTGQDARQLQNQLVPITKYIAEYTHKSVADIKKLQEAGGISSDIVFQAIQAQGKKVEGALNNSVRTIAGAKSVLSDTLRNFVQSNPGFAKIYDDLVQGIQKFSAEISKPETKAQIDRFLDSIGHIYEAIKPALRGLGDLAGSGGLSALSVFSHVLDGLATVLNAFPTGFLKIVGQTLGVLGALKAPLVLIKYAESISRVTQGLLGQFGATKQVAAAETVATTTTRAQTAATEQLGVVLGQVATQATVTTERMGFLARATRGLINDQGKFTKKGSNSVLGASVAAGLAGSYIQGHTGSDNIPAQTAGGALTYGALGAQIGATFGPEGAAIGALGGAALGAITSYLGASEEKLRKEIAKYKEIGKKTAEAYLREHEKAFQAGDVPTIQADIDKLAALQSKLDQLQNQKSSPSYTVGVDSRSSVDAARRALDDANVANIATVEGQIEAIKPQIEAITQPIFDAVEALRAGGHGESFFEQIIGQPVEGRTIKSIEDLDKAFREYGLTLTDVAAKGPQAVLELISSIDALDSAQKRATVTANVYAEALKDSTGKTKAIYDSLISNDEARIASISATESAKQAAIAVDKAGPQTQAQHDIAILTASTTLHAAQSKARALAEADATTAIDAAIKVAKAHDAQLAATLAATREATIAAAGDNAVKQVGIDVATAHTKALNLETVAIKVANDELARKRIVSDAGQAATSYSDLQTARQAAGASAVNPFDETARLTAKNTLLAAQESAANIAATKATQAAQDDLNADLRDHVIKEGSDNALRRQWQIDVAKRYITNITYEKILNDVKTTGIEIDRRAAEARARGNPEAALYLKKLTRAQEIAQDTVGPDIGKASAEVDRISKIDAVGSALSDALEGGATAAETAALNLAAFNAQASQMAALMAAGATETDAHAAALEYFNEVTALSKLNVQDVVDKVIGLNGVLDRVDGREAIINIVMTGITEAMAQIAALDIAIAQLTNAANGGPANASISGFEGRIGTSGYADYAAKAAQAGQEQKDKDTWKAEVLHQQQILQGLVEDDRDIFKNIGIKAQGDIQGTLDAEAEAARKAAEKATGKEDNTAEKFADAVANATESLAGKIQSAADTIAAAAEKWVNSIKERTQYEQAVSTSRLIKNAGQQGKDLTELTEGLAKLQSRGLSAAAIKSLGLDNIADTRQVRKLVKSSDSDLRQLSTLVAERDRLATDLTTTQEQAAQKKTITEAILDAAKALDIKTTKQDAAQIASQFNITTTSNAEEVALAILSVLSGGKIG